MYVCMCIYICVCVCVCVCGVCVCVCGLCVYLSAYIRKFKNVKRRKLCCLEPHLHLHPAIRDTQTIAPIVTPRLVPHSGRNHFQILVVIRPEHLHFRVSYKSLARQLLLTGVQRKAIVRTSYCQTDMHHFYISTAEKVRTNLHTVQISRP